MLGFHVAAACAACIMAAQRLVSRRNPCATRWKCIYMIIESCEGRTSCFTNTTFNCALCLLASLEAKVLTESKWAQVGQLKRQVTEQSDTIRDLQRQMARVAEKQTSQPRVEHQALQEMIAKAVHEHTMRNPPKVHIPSIQPVLSIAPGACVLLKGLIVFN
jgi:hypothetical protein